ncbi:hypothetical protein N481_07165 [Pseudoalteromonas luteoviolacea S4047-1]|uniref:Uncharacterized protein n=1 Tax=Pseudoalteromonas luteoviolacea S4054 TaxID=1129367 RepID=A0A0F6AEM9_9GAMM|nr:hypothetical protein N479_10250 [Pseudoalteromonas luteoviolacea S4054]KZN76124.1 hypothetical protein N481_07165 [Pseudoalteromonas luteoviolacea S4047-1]
MSFFFESSALDAPEKAIASADKSIGYLVLNERMNFPYNLIIARILLQVITIINGVFGVF